MIQYQKGEAAKPPFNHHHAYIFPFIPPFHLHPFFFIAAKYPICNQIYSVMSAPRGAPSPAPRSGSIGPGGGGMSMPPQQSMQSTTPGPTPGPAPAPSGAMSQQNLNQIVSFCWLISWLSSTCVRLISVNSLRWKMPLHFPVLVSGSFGLQSLGAVYPFIIMPLF